MKRNRFLAALLLMTVAQQKLLAKSGMPVFRNEKGFRIAAGEGRIHGHIQLGGMNPGLIDVKVSGSDTDGNLAIFEQTSLSKGAKVPLHFHPDQDEMFYVLEGSFRFKLGDDMYDLTTGDSIFLPRNVPHAWIHLSDKGRMHVLLQPAGKLENFFLTVSTLDHVPTPEEIKNICAENGMIIVGPPLNLD